jgi:protein SCO1/2
VALAAALLAGIAVAVLQPASRPPALQAGMVLPQARPLEPFSLQDVAGRPFDRSRFEGRWSLVFTGFTNCPDICPATLTLLGTLRRQVPEERVQFLFVSVDPARDTPEVLGRYLAGFGPGIVGATGPPDEIQRFTRQLGLGQVVNPGAGGAYTIDHSTALVLIDPQARLAGYFSAPLDAASIAADLAAL